MTSTPRGPSRRKGSGGPGGSGGSGGRRQKDVRRRTGKAPVPAAAGRPSLALLAGLGAVALAIVAIAAVTGGFFNSTPPAASHVAGSCPTTQPAPLAIGETRTVRIGTSKGTIVIEVDAALAPMAAGNFVALASCGYYDNLIFHRVVPDFVIQAGDGQYGRADALDRSKVGQGGPGYEFPDEAVVGDYTRGAVAMANSGADTNGSQFFICVADLTGRLSKDYTIFGKVTSGMDVVDAIVGAPADANDVPQDPIAMTSVTVATP
jgi:cyclophilin family peptidyl-prolyl cis-trans isomerase